MTQNNVYFVWLSFLQASSTFYIMNGTYLNKNNCCHIFDLTSFVTFVPSLLRSGFFWFLHYIFTVSFIVCFLGFVFLFVIHILDKRDTNKITLLFISVIGVTVTLMKARIKTWRLVITPITFPTQPKIIQCIFILCLSCIHITVRNTQSCH